MTVTRDEARTALAALAMATTAPLLTDAELDVALTASRLVDSEGRPPSDPEFVEENWDLYYAAAECMELKAMKQSLNGQITKFSSEGSSFEKTPPDFGSAADWFRDQSTVAGDGPGVVIVPLESDEPWWMRPRSSWGSEC